ncbi:MAG TPA: hemerythrin domain-containing protein [Acidimicrobiales bacterium]|nr:hemerythrin domain-containing protein [Acidimicrobiales bacterium]
MDETAPTGGDIVSLITADHESLRLSFEALAGAAGPDTGGADRARAFAELAEMLVRHEVAEEAVVYPALRKLAGGDRIADARIAEQAEAEQRLSELERFRPDASEFATTLSQLHSSVVEHAELEQRHVLPLLSEQIPEDRRSEMGQRYTKARASAPTHPHPSAPDTPPGNLVAGPVAALFDRIRDAASHD